MGKLGIFLIINFCFLFLLFHEISAIRINEIMPRTTEFVEIYNENNSWINLTTFFIKDNSTDNPDTINCDNIPNCSLMINFSFFIIIGKNTNISDITNSSINYFYVDDAKIGNGLNDYGDNISFYNSSFLANFNYNFSTSGLSWQFSNNSWIEALPTPGFANWQSQNQSQNCTPSYTNCSGWSECVSEVQNRTCFDMNQCSQNYTTETQNCSVPLQKNILLIYPSSVNYGEVFPANLSLLNFPADVYDVKIDITSASSQRLSQINDNGAWKSTFYYVDDIIDTSFSGSSIFLMNITEGYNGTGGIDVTIRNSNGNTYSFSGFAININYSPAVQNAANQNTSSTAANSAAKLKPYLEIEDIEGIYSNKEEDVSVNFYNLNGSYDLKLGVYNEDGKLMSEIYNENEKKWQSSNYYVKEAVSESENEDFKIRFKKEYANFSGDAVIEGKIRKTGTSAILDTDERDIEVKISMKANSTEEKNCAGTGESIINLETKGINNTGIYESKTEKMKKIVPYLLGAVLVLIIIFILIKWQSKK